MLAEAKSLGKIAKAGGRCHRNQRYAFIVIVKEFVLLIFLTSRV
jgi:hypothetical protein